MADKKISQLTPTTTVDLADKYALARGAGNFYVSYQTLQNNLATNTGSFVKTVNAVAPDAVGNVAVSLASVETGLSSSFPALPSDGDVYVISGETATDRTGSNGQSFIYSADSTDWFRLSGLDEAGNDARYVNISGDTMTGALTLPSDPTVALHAATKQYVDNSTAVGTNAQTLRFNGTTLEANSALTNDGDHVGVGVANPLFRLDVNDSALYPVRVIGSSTVGASIALGNNSTGGAYLTVDGKNGSFGSNQWMQFGQRNDGTGFIDMNTNADAFEIRPNFSDATSTTFEKNGNVTFNGRLTNVTDPTAAQDAATKAYVDSLVGDTGFISVPTLGSGWVNYGSGFATASYRKIGKLVFLGGLIKGGTFSSTSVIFTLPTGYRPSSVLIMPVVVSIGSTISITTGRVNISTNGQVVAVDAGVGGTNDYLNLEMSFAIA